jgi:hypothetical protein
VSTSPLVSKILNALTDILADSHLAIAYKSRTFRDLNLHITIAVNVSDSKEAISASAIKAEID